MTLIEIIKTSLLGFSALFVLVWIFFYLFLKFKNQKNQSKEENLVYTNPLPKVAQRPLVKQSPVYVQPVIYPSVYSNRHSHRVDVNRNSHNYNRESRREKVSNRQEKFVVFNNRQQYGFYNVWFLIGMVNWGVYLMYNV